MSRGERWAFGALVLLNVVVVGLLMLLSPDWTVSRHATVTAPPEVVFEVVGTAQGWSGQLRALDPSVTTTRPEGPSRGVGMVLAWQGKTVGEGRLEVVAHRPPEHVALVVRTGGVTLTESVDLARVGGGTEVTWTAAGSEGSGPLARVSALFAPGQAEPVLDRRLEVLAERVTADPTDR